MKHASIVDAVKREPPTVVGKRRFITYLEKNVLVAGVGFEPTTFRL
jgi:hypothetical protein